MRFVFLVVPETVWLLLWLLGTATSVGMSVASERKYDKQRAQDRQEAAIAQDKELARQQKLIDDQKRDQLVYDAKYDEQRKTDKYASNPMDAADRVKPYTGKGR